MCDSISAFVLVYDNGLYFVVFTEDMEGWETVQRGKMKRTLSGGSRSSISSVKASSDLLKYPPPTPPIYSEGAPQISAVTRDKKHKNERNRKDSNKENQGIKEEKYGEKTNRVDEKINGEANRDTEKLEKGGEMELGKNGEGKRDTEKREKGGEIELVEKEENQEDKEEKQEEKEDTPRHSYDEKSGTDCDESKDEEMLENVSESSLIGYKM